MSKNSEIFPRGLRAQMSRSSGSSSKFRLRFEDATSSTIVLEVDIDEMALADLLSTREAKIDVLHFVREEHYELLGLYPFSHGEIVPRDAYQDATMGVARKHRARKWADERVTELGSDYRVSDVRERNNGTIEAIFTRYATTVDGA